MNFYTTAFEGMPSLLDGAADAMEHFNRDEYPQAFAAYCSRHEATFSALEKGYLPVIDKNQYLENMAEELARAAEELLNAETKKQAREKRASDLNLCMVVYIIPAILEQKSAISKPFSEKVLEVWKRHFPKTNLHAADYEQINSGFKRKFCYITTAVCKTLGKPDDCYELNLFRNYRDTYLMSREDGEALVYTYYDVAPSIIKHINKTKNADEIYRGIWEDYLKPCMRMIEDGENEACMELYVSMVETMQERYFHTA